MLAASEELPKLQALSEACCNPTVTTTVKHHGLCFTGHEIQHEIYQPKFDPTSGPQSCFTALQDILIVIFAMNMYCYLY